MRSPAFPPYFLCNSIRYSSSFFFRCSKTGQFAVSWQNPHEYAWFIAFLFRAFLISNVPFSECSFVLSVSIRTIISLSFSRCSLSNFRLSLRASISLRSAATSFSNASAFFIRTDCFLYKTKVTIELPVARKPKTALTIEIHASI